MKLHKEGYSIVGYSLIIFVLVNAIVYYSVGKSLLFYFTLIVSAGLFAVILNFFRSPHRIFQGDDENVIVAPADGTIVVVEQVMENEYFQDKRLQVSIFMSLFNAHVNWIPVDGVVEQSFHQDGRFCAAYLPKSSVDNERSTVVIETVGGEKILVRQIAGAMARRIVTYTKPGVPCKINEQLGFIKFGSRVDLFLPLDAEIAVRMDETVKGNQTVIARLK